MVFTPGFYTLHNPDHRQAIFSKDEFYYLDVPRVGTYIVYNIFDCTFKCLNNPACLSLNLAASKRADGKLWCELLSSEKYSNSEEYKRNDTSHHYSMKVRETFRLTSDAYQVMFKTRAVVFYRDLKPRGAAKWF